MRYEIDRTKELLLFIKDNKRNIILVSAVSLLLSFTLFIIDHAGSPYIIENGKLVAIRVDSGLTEGEGTLSVPVTVTGRRGKKVTSEPVIIQMGKSEGRSRLPEEKDRREEELKRDMRQAASAVGRRENLYGDRALLPEKLSDGTVLSWKAPVNRKYLIFLLGAPIYLIWIWIDRREKEKKRREEIEEQVLRALPDFTDRVVLLTGSGLIFDDALHRIAESYRVIPRGNYFADMISEAVSDGEKTRRDLSALLSDRAAELNIREFSRITGIIEKNRKSGVDLRSELSREAELLWDARRKRAEIQGNRMEIKLSFPLALLLVVLIFITGAPAILQM